MMDRMQGDSTRSFADSTILVFDFISHAHMHLMFNEAYLRTVRSAFPDDQIVFHGVEAQVENLRPRLAGLSGIAFRNTAQYIRPTSTLPFDVWAERRSGEACLEAVERALGASRPRLVAFLGAEAGIHAAVAKIWRKKFDLSLHIILHGQLGQTFSWRSRNPLMRAVDLRSQLKKKPPSKVKLVALELGVKEAILELYPNCKESILELAHPILTSEWNDCEARQSTLIAGFLGSIRKGKGIEAFADLAVRCKGEAIAFEAVGHLSEPGVFPPEEFPFDISTTPVPREDYLKRLNSLSLVVLLMDQRAYDFTGSGTLCDAVAVLKPVVGLRNRPLSAIFEKYGPIGRLFDSLDELVEYFNGLNAEKFFSAEYFRWHENLKRLRSDRQPETLAKNYREMTQDN